MDSIRPGAEDGRRWLVIAATSRGAATAYADRIGLKPALIVERRQLLADPRALRQRVAVAGVDAALLHSLDWQRERAPQVAEAALALAPVSRRVLVDEATNRCQVRGRLPLLAGATRLPLEGARLAAMIAAAAGRNRLQRLASPRPGRSAAVTTLVAIWPGASGQVGGAVTHMSGILEAFRRAGVRVGLVSAGPVAGQLAAAVDEVEVVSPLARAYRLSADTEQLALDRELGAAAERLAARIGADLVYQRHRSLLGAGARLSAGLGVPFVLEWNASELWMRRNWDRPAMRLGPVERMVASAERASVRAATVVAAISTHAARMAVEAGAPPDRVAVVPNAVDAIAVDAALAAVAEPAARESILVGWIGTFGPWHGAPLLVRALALGPSCIKLRMIGDGRERQAAEDLARGLGVDDRIEWLGAIPHERALVALAECDILAAPHVAASASPFFGSPTKLFEYMAIGRPIVASRLAQLGEVLEDGRTALLVEPGDEAELAAAIARIAALPDRGAAIGAAAATEARERHTWDHRAAQILAAVRERAEAGS